MRLSGPDGATPIGARIPVRKRVVGLALLLLTLAGAACGDDVEPSEPGYIEGTVRDEQSGDRLKGARLVFTSDTLESGEGRSNKDGKYALLVETRTPRGRLRVSKKGYEPRVVSVFLDADRVQIDVDLAPLSN